MSDDGVTAETRAVLERYSSAWAAGDGATVFASYHDDLDLHYFGDNAFAGTHRGKPAAIAAMREVSVRMKRGRPTILAVMAGGDRGCVLARETMVTPAGEPVQTDRAMLYRVADGQIRECWVYDQDQRMVDAMIGP